MNAVVLRIGPALTIVAALLCGSAVHGQTGWPIQPTNAEHPLGNTLGEFWVLPAGLPYEHTGIDILAAPRAAAVVAAVEGKVTWYQAASTEVDIEGTDGTLYRYQHLEGYDAAFVVIGNNHGLIGQEARIAKVTPFGCGYDHLHYDISAAGKYLNPLATIEPNPDPFPPDIEIHLARHSTNPWMPIALNGTQCTVVSGDVDVVVQTKDQDNAGSSEPGTANVGLYNLSWRACPQGTPNCTAWNETHAFADMPTMWETAGNMFTKSLFSVTPPFVSTVNQCSSSGNETYMVASGPSPTASWSTTAGAYPDGSYTLRVEASDHANNTTARELHVCVQNGPGCVKDLAIRDGADDIGTVPYGGEPFHLSPDITVNPASADENVNVRVATANTVVVRVWNRGACGLPAGTTYNVCLAWSLPSSSIPFPLPAGQTVACQPQTVPATGWAAGTSRETTFNWTPASGTVPGGHACLVAWSTMPGDLPLSSASVVLDNNRAQRNIMFAPLSQSGATTSALWVYPLPEMTERTMEIDFRSDRDAQPLYLIVPPTMRIGAVTDARVIASVRELSRAEQCVAGDDSRCGEPCPRGAEACTLVLGEFASKGRITLAGIDVSERTQLRLVVPKPLAGVRAAPFEAIVVESAVAAGQPREAIGAVTLRFETPRTR